jgi:midasin (ATPase involved in ribosome maturation)
LFISHSLILTCFGDETIIDLGAESPRKRRKVDQALNVSEASWSAFQRELDEFEVQHVQGKGKFAFGFVEGPLVKAMGSGDWYDFSFDSLWPLFTLVFGRL